MSNGLNQFTDRGKEVILQESLDVLLSLARLDL